MHSPNWKIAKLTVVLASLGCGLTASLPAQAGDLDWQTLCQQYFSTSTCGSNVAADAWVNSQATSLAEKLPTLPAGTSEIGLNCFMRNIDGSLLDLSQLCNATADHPVLAQISVKNSVKEQAGMHRKSSVFTFK
jgi:hypothetical protein